MVDVPAPVRDALAKLALDTPLRQGIERVSAARIGGLFVLGHDDTVDALCRQGFDGVAIEASPDNLSQFSKMDLAIVLSEDTALIRRFNTALAPTSTVWAEGVGARHLTALRTAHDIAYPVVAVSEETGQATVFVGRHVHVLSPRPLLLAKAVLAVEALGPDVETLSCQPDDLTLVGEVAERARRTAVELELYLLELGDRGGYLDRLLDKYCAALGLDRRHADPDGVPNRVRLMHAVVEELDDWYEQMMRAADTVLGERAGRVLDEHDRAFPRISFDSDRAAIRWYDEKADRLLDSIRRALETGEEKAALRRSLAMLEYFYRRKPWARWLEILTVALLAAREIGDAAAEASLLTSLGIAQREVGNHREAFQLWDAADKVWRELDDHLGRAELLNHLAYAWDERGEPVRALECAAEALGLIGPGEDERLRGKVLNTSGGIRGRLGEFDVALDLADQAIAAFDTAGYRRGVVWATSNKGDAYRVAGQHREAVECYRIALAERLDSEERYGAAVTRSGLGRSLAAVGDLDGGTEHLRLAEAYFRELGDPRAAEVRADLEQLGA
jgi:diadenylate cyclase